MVNKKTQDALDRTRAQYQKLAITHRDATEAGDYRKANNAYDRLNKLFNSFRRDSETASKLLDSLLMSNDIRVRTWAATHCLSLNVKTEAAAGVLEQAAKSRDLRLLAFTAEKTLEVWKKGGPLTF